LDDAMGKITILIFSQVTVAHSTNPFVIYWFIYLSRSIIG